MNVDKTKIQNRINELTASIESCTNTQAEIDSAEKYISNVIFGITSGEIEATFFESEEYKNNFNIAKINSFKDEISRLTQTLNADLMEVKSVYVVTDQKNLVSPSGFHPDDKVFIQTKIAIHTDSVKRLPHSNVQLYAHKVN